MPPLTRSRSDEFPTEPRYRRFADTALCPKEGDHRNRLTLPGNGRYSFSLLIKSHRHLPLYRYTASKPILRLPSHDTKAHIRCTPISPGWLTWPVLLTSARFYWRLCVVIRRGTCFLLRRIRGVRPAARYFYDRKTLAQRLAVLHQRNPHILDQVMEIADHAVNWEFPNSTCPTILNYVPLSRDYNWRSNPTSDPEFPFGMNQHRCWFALGHAWALTGDDKYAEAWGEQFDSWDRGHCPHESVRGTPGSGAAGRGPFLAIATLSRGLLVVVR